MKKINRFYFRILTTIIFLFPSLAFSQTSDVEMADTFRSDGKIYVVIAVIGVILLGLILYLIFIDRKISKMEKKLNDTDRFKREGL